MWEPGVFVLTEWLWSNAACCRFAYGVKLYKSPPGGVAKLAGGSRATAARRRGIWLRPPGPSDVEAAAETLGYRGNALARSVSSGRSHTIGVVISDIENPHFARAVRGITDAAKKSGFDVILANTDENLGGRARCRGVFLAEARRRAHSCLDVPKRLRPSAGCCEDEEPPGAF